MARIELKTDADTRGAKRLNKELEKTDKELEEIGKTARGTARQAQKLAEMADPTKKLSREYAILAKHVKAGRVSMEDAEKIAGKYQRRLDRMADSGKQAVGPAMIGNLQSMAAGYLSIGTAVAVVSRGLAEMEEKARSAAEATLGGLGSIGELQQISATPEDFQKNLGFARSLVARGISADIGQAADTTFSLRSAGFSDSESEYLAGLAAAKQIKGESLVGFGGALRKTQGLFPGGVSVEDIADKIVATSGITQVGASQTALASSQFAAASANLGFSGDASLAALSTIETRAKNIDEAATQYANLLDAIDKGGLSAGSLPATLDSIQARVDAGEGAFEVLGNKRAVKGFRALQMERGLLASQTDAIANSSGALSSRRFLSSDPVTRAAALAEESQGKANSAQDRLTSERELIGKAIANEQRAARLAEGREGAAGFMGMLDASVQYRGQETLLVEDVLRGVGPEVSAAVKSAAADYALRNFTAWERGGLGGDDYLRRIAEATEKAAASSAGRQE